MSSTSSADGNSTASTATTATTGGVAKNSTTTNGPAPDTDTAVSTPKQASGAWQEFQEATEKMLKHSRTYSDIERTMDRQSAMELELQALKDQVLRLELNEHNQIRGFEARYDEWKDEKSLLENQKKKVEGEMAEKHTREMEQAEKALADETERANTLAKRLERVNAQMSLVKKELVVCNDKLRDWESYTTKLKEVDFETLSVKLNQLFRDCYSLVNTHFGLDLPLEPPVDYTQWEKQVTELALPLRFPPTNSPAAKRVRVAAALNILATYLCANIFKPCYIPESAADSETIKEILGYQSATGLRKEEKFVRALLISMYPDEQVKAAIHRAVQITVEDILKCLSFFLNDRVQTFKTGLAALLKRAAHISVQMQQSEKMVEVNVEGGDFAERPDEYLQDFGKIVPLTSPAKFEMLNLFPHIYVPEDGTVVLQGVFLFPDQEVVVTAEQELRDFKAGMRARNGRGICGSAIRESKRERRQSTVIGGENGSILASPTSP